MYVIGMNPYGGLFTKTEMKRGKIPQPGNSGAVAVNGDSKQFVAVKLAAATYINGTVIRIDDDVNGFSAAPASAPANVLNGRVGILVFASATATQTMAGTSYGWVQVYGKCLARVSTTVSLFGSQLVLADTVGQLINGATVTSADSQLDGITAITTQSVSGLLTVFLSYPRLRGLNDTNLA